MRRIGNIAVAVAILLSAAGCGNMPLNGGYKSTDSASGSEYEITGAQDSAVTTVSISDINARRGVYLCDPEPEDPDGLELSEYAGMFEYEALAEKSGMNIEVHGLSDENQTLKILAGDSDIDIYFLYLSDMQFIKEKGLCSPIESDIIEQFNSKTFSALRDYCVDENGDIIAMPVSQQISALYAPKRAVDELGIEAEDIEYLDDFLELVRSYDGKRQNYGFHTMFYYELENQYHYYYCDLENGEFEYDNEVFRKLYEDLLGGWVADGNDYRPEFSKFIGDYVLDEDENLFTYISISRMLSVTDAEKNKTITDSLVCFPIPKLDENVENNVVSSAAFTYINPYSKNKEAAIELLETIAQNYYEVTYWYSIPYIFSDMSMYPDAIDTDSQLFKDYIAMCNNSKMLLYSVNDEVSYIDWQYSRYELTLDDAIAERTRVVDIKLNE